jgi:hypothetical protein
MPSDDQKKVGNRASVCSRQKWFFVYNIAGSELTAASCGTVGKATPVIRKQGRLRSLQVRKTRCSYSPLDLEDWKISSQPTSTLLVVLHDTHAAYSKCVPGQEGLGIAE